MSLQEPLPLEHPPQPRKERQLEVALLQRLQQARSDPALVALRQLLQVRLDLCRNKLVKASLNDVPLIQGEARAFEKLLTDLSGERTPPE